ncbi:RCC1/BLIP-II protein [Calocera cornea HHB12733]|uniref:RCC1/BLIP-II protein n=1 Tax=Calocera cornea HHB12733 TaxID=1353952 RepID=A0A165FPN6_9BASI|nr:RCC1/BLIP-II protein [Calocera cornea HHB12733]
MSPQARTFAAGLRRSLRQYRSQGRQISFGLAATSGLIAFTVLGAGVLHADTAAPTKKAPQPPVPVEALQEPGKSLIAWSWGANDYKVASSSASTSSNIRSPQPLPHLSGVALRDLALHEKHGACVDAAGNVYQWGDGFFEAAEKGARKPKLTLKGKDIQNLSVTAKKVYALSKSGKVYVLSADEARQEEGKQEPAAWWTFAWIWRSQPTVGHVELKPDSALARREKFTSISSGKDHLLALTSAGRAFSHAVNANANAYGQLGFDRISIASPSSPSSLVQIPLIPKAVKDPLAQSTPYARPPAGSSTEVGDDSSIKWSTTLYEIPSLKGVSAKQLVAGGRSSYLLTAEEGRALAWGANEYGQLGLGATMTLTSVPIPTEVVLSRPYPRGTAVKCTHIAAGGDIVYYTVERTLNGERGVDVLAAGMGQWGLLGTGMYNQVQGQPVKVRAVSGLMEYNDATQALEALSPRAIAVSPTGHVLLTLNALTSTNAGYDVLAWGQNRSSELGNGKQVPVPLPGYVRSFRPEPGARLMVREGRGEVRDLEGRRWGRKVDVRETVVAGYGCTAVYWKIV